MGVLSRFKLSLGEIFDPLGLIEDQSLLEQLKVGNLFLHLSFPLVKFVYLDLRVYFVGSNVIGKLF